MLYKIDSTGDRISELEDKKHTECTIEKQRKRIKQEFYFRQNHQERPLEGGDT